MDVQTVILFALSATCLVNLVLVTRVLARVRAADHLAEADRHAGGEPLRIGTLAPAFNALTLAGKGITSHRLGGRTVLYVFVSPNCGSCRGTLASLGSVGPLARRAGADLIVVSDSGPERTRAWLAEVTDEDGVRVTDPVLAAPASRSTMVADYNPPGLIPYFCLIGGDGQVLARGHVGGPDWKEQLNLWMAAGVSGAAA